MPVKGRTRVESAEDRFWSHVNEFGPINPFCADLEQCWVWSASVDSHGYGQIWIGTRNERAHRFSYELHIGQIPEGELVCHHCDVKRCVRPSHFFLGDHSTNELDLVAKGLHYSRSQPEKVLRGELHGMARVTEEQVREIRRRIADGEQLKAVGGGFGLTESAIWRIVHRKTWQQVI